MATIGACWEEGEDKKKHSNKTGSLRVFAKKKKISRVYLYCLIPIKVSLYNLAFFFQDIEVFDSSSGL